MAKLTRSLFTLGFGLVVLLGLSTSAAACPTCLLSGVFEIADADKDKVIPGGFPSTNHARQCAPKGSCPQLEDVAFKDVDISDEMEDYTEEARFTVSNVLVSTTTLWYVCSFDDAGTALNCFVDEDTSWGLSGELGPDARELRLMPVQSAPNEYWLDLYVN